MTTVLVVGAGFSTGVHSAMPLTTELARRVVREDSAEFYEGVTDLLTDGEQLERWLSTLAEPQPYLSLEVNLTNQARFHVAVRAIRSEIEAGQFTTESEPIPIWLEKLIRLLHTKLASVVTLNYDTLLEAATTHVLRTDLKRPSLTPQFRSRRETLRQDPRTATAADSEPSFRLMKLHGSLDTFWVPGDPTGQTVERLPGRVWGENPKEEVWDPDLLPPGREPFIIPPAAAKSAFYSNPVTTQIWRDAQQSLQGAERVFVVGYSLPLTDLTIGGLLHSALHTCTRHPGNVREVHVVDPNPAPIVERLKAVGISPDVIRSTTIDPSGDCLEPWVEELVAGEDLTIYPRAT